MFGALRTKGRPLDGMSGSPLRFGGMNPLRSLRSRVPLLLRKKGRECPLCPSDISPAERGKPDLAPLDSGFRRNDWIRPE